MTTSPNSLKQRLANGEVVIGGMVTHFLRPAMMKIYANCGFDFIYVENEHAMHDPTGFTDCVLAALDNGIALITKPPYMDRGEIARLLDAGVTGLQLPQSETRDQIDTFGAWVRYPPQGTRMVACASGLNNFEFLTLEDLQRLDRETLVIAHVETKRGADNIEEIAASPFVDVVFIGQADLSVSFGKPYDFEAPEFVAAVERIIRGTLDAGKIVGMYMPTAAYAQQWLRKGVTFIETADEISFIASGARSLLQEFRDAH